MWKCHQAAFLSVILLVSASLRAHAAGAGYGLNSPKLTLPESTPIPAQSTTVRADEKLLRTINGFLNPHVFDEVLSGGPFGRLNQIRLGMTFPGEGVLFGQETVLEAISKREQLWDECNPWTEGLAMLFDAAQLEVFSQFDALGDDARQAESLILKLSPLQRTAYKHLREMKSGNSSTRSIGEASWLELLNELDKSEIKPNGELKGKARDVLIAARRKGQVADTWIDCYRSTVGIVVGTGKPTTLKREVTHALHNCAKAAGYHIAKVWNPKELE